MSNIYYAVCKRGDIEYMAIKNNTVNIQGIEVYESSIQYYADEYINSLDGDEDEIKSLMRKAPPFKGMLKYIYNNVFKITDKDIRYNNKNSRIDYSDIDLINQLWDIYTGLCYKYLQNPTLLNFSLFTGIAHETLTDWTTGNYRSGGDVATSPHCQSAKKWLKECESALVDSAMTGNPGPMFLLKANYNYTEQPQRIEIVGGQDPQQVAAEIAARHQIGQAERPELPALE